MRKSNWIIIGIFVIASIVFLAMWFLLGFDQVDFPLDLITAVVWWVLIVLVCVVIHFSEKRRQRLIRTAFLAPNLIYNSEAGIIRLQPGESYVPALSKMIANLDYGFENPDGSSDETGKRIHFRYIVHTEKFANNGNTWKGDVIEVARPDTLHVFNNQSELAALLKN